MNKERKSMKKMWKRIMTAAVTASMAAGLLAGCGSSASTADGSAAEGTASAANDGKTHIEFFNQKTEIVDILNTLIADYEKENPNVVIDLVTPSDAATVLSTRMASDDMPDVFTQWPNASFFTQVDSGYVMDLSGTGIMDNIQDVARDQWKHDGGEYAATMSYNCSGIWYNKDLFEKAGISEIPSTWDELVKDCETLKNAGITPFVTTAKETDRTDRQLQVFLASAMGSNYDAFEKDAGDAKVDPTAEYAADLKKMAERMVTMISYSQADPMGTDQDSATANFANGEGAMMIGGSWLLASITAANPDINISMMPIPGDTAEDTNTCAYPGGMSLCVAAKTDVQDEAVSFVKWMTSTEVATKYAEAEGNPSCIKGVDHVADQFSEIYSNFVTTGKFVLNPDCNWTSAQQNAAGSAVQQLYYDQDASAFPENLASAFNDN
jgi:raffinose/stachyose/melibiose transport system substrate-binding protein